MGPSSVAGAEMLKTGEPHAEQKFRSVGATDNSPIPIVRVWWPERRIPPPPSHDFTTEEGAMRHSRALRLSAILALGAAAAAMLATGRLPAPSRSFGRRFMRRTRWSSMISAMSRD